HRPGQPRLRPLKRPDRRGVARRRRAGEAGRRLLETAPEGLARGGGGARRGGGSPPRPSGGVGGGTPRARPRGGKPPGGRRVGIGELGFGAADRANRTIRVRRRALEDRDPLILLAGDGELVVHQVQRESPGLVRYRQPAYRRDVAVRVVRVHDQTTAIVVDGVDLPPGGIERDAGDEAQPYLATDDMPAWFGRRRGLTSCLEVVREQGTSVLVAEHHDPVLRIDRHPVEDRVGVVDDPRRTHVTAGHVLSWPAS